MADSSAFKAPWHLWLVGVLSLLWNGFGAFDFTATVTRFEPYLSNFPPAMIEHLYTLPAWMWLVWAAGVWGALIGSVLLLVRNKLSVWAFAASLAGAAISMLASLIAPPPPEVGANIGLAVVIVAIAAGLFFYALGLSRRGVLA